ncbi:hypothetical protein LCGC14_1680270 [marine sediment metagenome]|uniref:Glucose-methanol-choline oxidoreductase N-terminal domain-containing protein n=1 Tax=marine sediment metagenome TaxID=412755 RepID=A0A0F9KNX2_9ZZZZ
MEAIQKFFDIIVVGAGTGGSIAFLKLLFVNKIFIVRILLSYIKQKI